MRALNTNPNVDLSDLVSYPSGRLRNNTGVGNGTPVNERVYGDLHQTIAKLLRLYAITPNNLPDNEVNGFQIIDALSALASKNDYVIPLSLDSGVLRVPIKIGLMKEGEAVICQSGFNLSTETQIKGSDAPVFTVAFEGSFKTNENVRLIKTSAGITLVRLADHYSLDAMNAFLSYLKKASQTEENEGVLDTVGTTPQTNLLAFTRRTIGVDSSVFLATLLRNGLYNSEHFALVEGLRKVKNKGWFSGVTVADAAIAPYPVEGDIASAINFDSGQAGNTAVTVTMANAMDNLNYFVKIYVESQGNPLIDNDCYLPVFKKISTTVFNFYITSASPADAKNLKIHIEAVQL